jgi:transcriptional regulator with XRE-family HTH domain
MKLAVWFSLQKIRREDFARQIGVSIPSVTRYMNGTRFPSAGVFVKIAKATDGAVTPNDFLLPAPKDEAAE